MQQQDTKAAAVQANETTKPGWKNSEPYQTLSVTLNLCKIVWIQMSTDPWANAVTNQATNTDSFPRLFRNIREFYLPYHISQDPSHLRVSVRLLPLARKDGNEESPSMHWMTWLRSPHGSFTTLQPRLIVRVVKEQCAAH